MAEDLKFRTLGEVVGSVRDNRQLGRVGIAVFPGVSEKLYAQISEAEALKAGIDLSPGSFFTARVNLGAQTAEELHASDLDVLLTDEPVITDDGSILE